MAPARQPGRRCVQPRIVRFRNAPFYDKCNLGSLAEHWHGYGMNQPRRRTAFRQHDLQRALKAAKAAGLDISRVEIDPVGKIAIITKGADSDRSPTVTPLDTWLANARPS
jgi:hypothetical protein